MLRNIIVQLNNEHFGLFVVVQSVLGYYHISNRY